MEMKTEKDKCFLYFDRIISVLSAFRAAFNKYIQKWMGIRQHIDFKRLIICLSLASFAFSLLHYIRLYTLALFGSVSAS